MAEDIFLVDKSRWKGRELKAFADEANRFTDAVLKNEQWDDFMRRASRQYDVMRAIWRDPAAPLGYSIGVLKGADKAMRQANGKVGSAVKAMSFRLRNREIADAIYLLYGDGRADFPQGPHLLDLFVKRPPMPTTH
ncbi:hypothetical protein MKK55_18730 [Methylobacterium sp. J-059]|uniref:hypothetical protein n=1 Tax=Methylobacterium sp. J-059 TaxID=2836643 RepID=UPI001FBA10EE|nr:hypothetical protein [Methylobacterium sp. J-059]MCJ2040967.1 hypothetical protein [Methylobacterium sp. J-059]